MESFIFETVMNAYCPNKYVETLSDYFLSEDEISQISEIDSESEVSKITEEKEKKKLKNEWDLDKIKKLSGRKYDTYPYLIKALKQNKNIIRKC